MSKVIAHIDLNAFFATCEEIRNPSLAAKPIAIGGEGRSGIISTCNYEARKYGVHSAMPTFQAHKACPDLIVIPPDFEYYQVMSNSFFGYLSSFSQMIEKASIDECFVDFTEQTKNLADPIGYFKNIQNGLLNETGLKCSIGVSPNKWLSKMASDMKKPMGLTFIRKKEIKEKIFPLPVEDFWGIGKKTSPLLKEIGINTIGDLAIYIDKNDPRVDKILGKFKDTAAIWLSGNCSDEIVTENSDPKSISCSETLMHDATSYEEIAPILVKLCKEVSSKAKENKKVGSTISLTLKDSLFKVHQKSVTIDLPTDSSNDIYRVCRAIFDSNYSEDDNFSFRLVGVCLSKLEDKAKQSVQMSFWNYSDFEKMDKTKLLIESLNREANSNLFTRASEAERRKK